MKRVGLLAGLAALLLLLVLVLTPPAALGTPQAAFGNPQSALVPPIFGPNVKANSDSSGFGQHEPSLAVSRVHTNTVVIAQKDYRNGNDKQVWIESSTDGGATWPLNRQLQMPGVDPTNFPNESDAWVLARDDGRIYVAALGYNNNNAVFITWTDNDGATWVPSVQISPTDGALDDKDVFAIDNNPASPYYHRMYMMYAPGANYVAEQHSTDGGLTWTARQQIGANDTEYTYPVVASDGTVYNFMMFNWGAGQTGTILMTKSTNGGATWSAVTTVSSAVQPPTPIRTGDQFRFFAILSAAVDPNNGSLYVAWTDSRNYMTNGTDVVYVKSTNGGASWSAVTRLSHDPTGVVRDHITPMVVVGADSKVHAFWLDRRLDAANHLFDSWYSSSTDGGTTWDPDTRVSTASQDLNVGLPPGSGGAAGDYWGLDTTADTVYVAWNDARDGVQQDIYVAKGLLPGGATATPTRTGTPPTGTPTVTSGPASATATRTVTPPPSATSGPASPTSTGLPTFPPATVTPTGTITPGPCDPAWHNVPSPNLGVLNAVSAAATDDVWAAGATGMLHWNGSLWTAVAGAPTGMMGVAAIGPGDVWAVGGNSLNHWNGSTWTAVAHPEPTPIWVGSHPVFRAVSAGAANSVWAVGDWDDIGGNEQSLVEHWDGSAWTILCSFCLQADAAPQGGTLDYLYGVDALSATEAWAVGYSTTGGYALAAQCTATTCTPHNAASLGPIRFLGVAALASNNVWAVGENSVIAHWDGSSWTQVAAPNVSTLNDVDGVAANDLWAVGAGGFLHWDGTAWSIVTSVTPASLFSVVALAPRDVWAVGGWVGVGVTERYSDAPYFTDVPTSQPFYSYIQWMACRTYISGYNCGSPGEPCDPQNRPYFRAGLDVTRGQLLKMTALAAGWPLLNPPNASRTFEDVPSTSPFYTYIETGASHGIISGYTCGGPGEPCVLPGNRPYFRSGNPITRGQISKVIALAKGYNIVPPPGTQTFHDVPSTDPFYGYIEAMAAHSIVSGYTCGSPTEPCDPQQRPYFRAGANATRGQVTKFVTLAYGGP